MAPARETEKLKIFISYSRHDSAAADALVDSLFARGFEVTIDRRDLPFGEKWQAELADLIRLSDTVLWLVSETSVASKWVNWELDEVSKRNKRLVPVSIGEVDRGGLPRQLGQIHILPAEGHFDLTRDLDTLVTVLQTDRAWLKQASRLQDRAAEWLAKGRTSALLLSSGALAESEHWKDQRPPTAPLPPQEVLDLLLASRRALTRRQSWWLTGAVIIALSALTLSALTYWQSNLANKRYAAAKAAADSITLNLARDLRAKENIPQETVEVLLKAADGVMSRLLEDSGQDSALQLSYARMLFEFAQVFWYRGANAATKDYSERCLGKIDNLIAGHIEHALRADALMLRYFCLYQLGDAERNAGRLQESEKAFQASATQLDDLLRGSTDPNTDLLKQLVRVRARLGDLLRTEGRFQEAEVEYETALRATDQLASRSPGDEEIRQQISWRHNQIGDNMLHITSHEELITVTAERAPYFTGRPLQEALGHYEVALQIRRELYAARQRDSDRWRDMVWSMALTGMAKASVDIKSGKEILLEGLAEARKLVESDPENTERLRYQAFLYNLLGDVLLREGRDDDAFTQYSLGLKIRKAMTERTKDNARWTRDLFYTFARLARLCQLFGHHTGCDGSLDAARELGASLKQTYRDDNVLARAISRVAAPAP